MTWAPNLALHRKIAARVLLSAAGAQQQDACDETRTYVGPNWELDLIRDSVTVATITFNSLMTLGTEQLTATSPASTVLSAAAIASGTWTAKIRSSDGTYELDTSSVGTSGTDVVVSADIDPAVGVTVSITLAFDADLTSGSGAAVPDWVTSPFTAASPWNSDIPGSAVFSTDARTTQIRTAVQWGVASFNYTPNVFYATASSQTQTVLIHNLYGSFADFEVTIPWPADAVPNGFATGQQGSDHWICILDPDGVTAHEMFYAQWNGLQWQASSYCRTRLDGTGWNLFSLAGINTANTLSAGPNNNGGAPRAVSVSLLGGLIRQDELVSGINHALAIAIPNGWLKGATGSRVYPADTVNYADGGNNPVPTGPIPYSTRFGLHPSLDIGALGLPADWLKVADALQRKGAYVVDVAGWSGSPSFYGEWPNAYSQVQALRDTQGTHASKLTSRLYALDWV